MHRPLGQLQVTSTVYYNLIERTEPVVHNLVKFVFEPQKRKGLTRLIRRSMTFAQCKDGGYQIKV